MDDDDVSVLSSIDGTEQLTFTTENVSEQLFNNGGYIMNTDEMEVDRENTKRRNDQLSQDSNQDCDTKLILSKIPPNNANHSTKEPIIDRILPAVLISVEMGHKSLEEVNYVDYNTFAELANDQGWSDAETFEQLSARSILVISEDGEEYNNRNTLIAMEDKGKNDSERTAAIELKQLDLSDLGLPTDYSIAEKNTVTKNFNISGGSTRKLFQDYGDDEKNDKVGAFSPDLLIRDEDGDFKAIWVDNKDSRSKDLMDTYKEKFGADNLFVKKFGNGYKSVAKLDREGSDRAAAALAELLIEPVFHKRDNLLQPFYRNPKDKNYYNQTKAKNTNFNIETTDHVLLANKNTGALLIPQMFNRKIENNPIVSDGNQQLLNYRRMETNLLSAASKIGAVKDAAPLLVRTLSKNRLMVPNENIGGELSPHGEDTYVQNTNNKGVGTSNYTPVSQMNNNQVYKNQDTIRRRDDGHGI
jgi:hypothetical protein